MPIYEYTCQDCEAHFEKFVRSVAAASQIVCPECGGAHVKKGWSVFGTKVDLGLGSFTAPTASNCAPSGT